MKTLQPQSDGAPPFPLEHLVGDLRGTEQDRQTLAKIERMSPAPAYWQELLEGIVADPISFSTRFAVSRGELRENLSLSYRKLGKNYSNVWGRLGLLLLSMVVIEQSERQRSATAVPVSRPPGKDSPNELADLLVSDPAVQDAVQRLYDPDVDRDLVTGQELTQHEQQKREEAIRVWQGIDFTTLRFHRFGSTSFILCGQERHEHGGKPRDLALKCVLYPYSRIPQIAAATKEYADLFGGRAASHRANVWASTARWIVMDFIPGDSLAEWLERDTAQKDRHGRRRLRLDLMRKLAFPLFTAMAEMEEDGKHHEDLSPTNIIIQQEESHTGTGEETTYRATLVDLGRNHLYTGAIGALEGPESRYVAPEIRDAEEGAVGGQWRADVYSLGCLLIALGGVGRNEDGTVPDQFYESAPPLARFIEDLTDRTPARRLLLFKPSTGKTFLTLGAVFQQELDAVSKAEERHVAPGGDHWFRAALELFMPSSRSPRRYFELWRERRRQETNRDPLRSMFVGRMLFWSVVCAACWYLISVVLVVWTMRDLGLDVANAPIQLAQRILGRHGMPFIDDLRVSSYHIPDLLGNLPARVVGMSFALAGTKYYQNIYAGLTPRLAPGTLGRFTNLAMRLFAWWSAPLILTANLINPQWWAINTSIGLTAVFITNWAVSAFSNRAIEQARYAGLSTVPGGHRKIAGLELFGGWAPSVLVYTASTWPIAILITVGILKDTLVYMGGVAAANVGVFYIEKCSRQAGLVRGGIARAFLAAERVHLSTGLPPRRELGGGFSTVRQPRDSV